MEKITIQKLDRRGNMLIVTHDKGEHTMQTGWQGQAVTLIEALGVGGTVDVEFDETKPKPGGGFYMNISKVDMNSGHQGEKYTEEYKQMDKDLKEPSRDDKIVAQCLLKCATELIASSSPKLEGSNDAKALGEALNEVMNELHGAFLVELDRLK